ncbi:hypothetical protein EVAR_54951_1 [Eumeta japonica]|uniref:Histone-lysine N-methyltransferase SETMAR n=1 Tax=Eumeta variegata TaxID=151549 RepID=A0A4C1YPB4_EUMVA|nr:hypothetical protein EVAR_54951_1 [Eumeta japonica]
MSINNSTLTFTEVVGFRASPTTPGRKLRMKRIVVERQPEDSTDGISGERSVGKINDRNKAFDCVHHDTLIRKLHHYGVTGRSLRLLESYLSDRIQRVDINAFHDEAPSLATVNNWLNEFKRGRTNLTDDLREGHTSMATTKDNINAMRIVIEIDKRLT